MKQKMTVLAGLMALTLAACTQNNGGNIGQGFSMGADISGVSVSDGIPTPAQVVFNARPQSVGMQLRSFTVEVQDSAGAPYASSYQRSANAVILPGYVCSAPDPANAAPPLDQCLPNNKTAANVSTKISLPLVLNEVAQQIKADCAAGTCPTLRMKVTFTGIDDAGRIQNVVVSAVTLNTQ